MPKLGFNLLAWTASISDAYFPHIERLKKIGYDGIEIMGSEGYLLNQFLTVRGNERDDQWGGDFERRMRFPLEVVRRIRARVGTNFIIVYRLMIIDYCFVEQFFSKQ